MSYSSPKLKILNAAAEQGLHRCLKATLGVTRPIDIARYRSRDGGTVLHSALRGDYLHGNSSKGNATFSPAMKMVISRLHDLEEGVILRTLDAPDCSGHSVASLALVLALIAREDGDEQRFRAMTTALGLLSSCGATRPKDYHLLLTTMSGRH